MMCSFLSREELRERVAKSGHTFGGDQSSGASANRISPPLDIYLTLGAKLDPTLIPAARQRYYCCRLNSPEDPTPAIRDDPAFALSGPIAGVEDACPSEVRFILGPFRWLLRRLARFDGVLLWPADRYSSGSSAGFEQEHLLDDLSHLRRRLPGDLMELAAIGAVTLDLDDEDDCRVLWEVAVSVATSFDDWLVSDPGCLEIYTMHHHGKVVASIPDDVRRGELLSEFDDLDELIRDCSGYE